MKVITELYKHPMIDATGVSEITGLGTVSSYKLIKELERLEMLKEMTGSKRGRIYVLEEYIRIFD